MSETIGQIFTLLPKVMDSIGAVGKDRRAEMNGRGSYAFRGIDDLYNAVQPALIKHGITVFPHTMEILNREERIIEKEYNGRVNKTALFYTTLRVTYRFSAPDGSFVEATTIGEAMDSGDKSANKAMSAAMKYALMQVLCIPTEEPKDSENDTHDEIQPRQQAEPKPPVRQPVANKAPANGKTNGKSVPGIATAIRALHLEWAQKYNRGKESSILFVQWAERQVENPPDMTNPENWDADLLNLIEDAIKSGEPVGAA